MKTFRLEYDTTQDDAVWIMLRAINELLEEKKIRIEMAYSKMRCCNGWVKYEIGYYELTEKENVNSR